MKLGALIKDMAVKAVEGPVDIEIKGIAFDSRAVRPGDLFVALKGGHVDGRRFVEDAVRRGAAAAMSEGALPEGMAATLVGVLDARDAMALTANNFYGRPSEALTLVGVTGTNGKTTTTYLIKSVLEAAGHRAGLIGTVGYQVGDKCYPAPHTTPEAPVYQGLLREMLEAGCTHVVSEVSSHALDQKRVAHTVFRAAVFTNLTREHLDYHVTMEEYFRAKKALFLDLLKGAAVVNIDDPFGAALVDEIAGEAITYSMMGEADIKASDIENTPDGLRFKVHYKGSAHEIASPLIGVVNVYNVLSAAGVALALGIGWERIAEGIKKVANVPGRFEKVVLGQGFLCVVDYAHTHDALERLIRNARELVQGRVITVFGCGGERDRGKRPLMGAAATGLSDLVFVTSDNPRGEDPEEIIKEILSGVKVSNYSALPDRREAIRRAIKEAGDGDIVLIAGKGHEGYQEVKGVRQPFSDRAVAEEAIREAMGGG